MNNDPHIDVTANIHADTPMQFILDGDTAVISIGEHEKVMLVIHHATALARLRDLAADGETKMLEDAAAEWDDLLDQLGRAKFLIQAYQEDQDGPHTVTATLPRGSCTDVMVLVDQQTAAAWRTPAGTVDKLAPTMVHWQIAGHPLRVLTELLALPEPGHPRAPVELMAAMPEIGLPAERRGTPVRIRRRGI